MQSEISASGQGVKQNRKRDVWKREAGSAMGLLNVYSAFELFLMRVNPQLHSLTAHNRMQLLQAACQKPAQTRLRRFCSAAFRSHMLRNIHSAKLRLRKNPNQDPSLRSRMTDWDFCSAQDNTRGEPCIFLSVSVDTVLYFWYNDYVCILIFGGQNGTFRRDF